MNQFIQLSFEEKKKMGRYGREKMANEFDKEVVVEETIKKLERE